MMCASATHTNKLSAKSAAATFNKLKSVFVKKRENRWCIQTDFCSVKSYCQKNLYPAANENCHEIVM